VLAPDAVILVDPPGQYAAATGVTVNTGIGLTVIVCVFVPTQPAALVPVTVYVVVLVALQVTVAPVEALNPVAGFQL
jgi:hypothetical protein